MERGDSKSERLEHLQILSDSMFFRIQEIFRERANRSDEKNRVAMSNKGKSLLNGKVFCAHCGGRMCMTSTKEKYTRKDGSLYEKETIRYLCYHRSRKLRECDGTPTYRADVIDKYVLEVMNTIFSNIKGCPKEEKIQSAYQKVIAGNKQMQRKLAQQLEADRNKFESFRLEIGKALAEESLYSPEDLALALKRVKDNISENERKLEELQKEESEKQAMSDSIVPAYNQFKTWADTFMYLPFENKKMIASQLFSRVEIGKDYQIHLEIDTTYQAFCEDWVTPQDELIIA